MSRGLITNTIQSEDDGDCISDGGDSDSKESMGERGVGGSDPEWVPYGKSTTAFPSPQPTTRTRRVQISQHRLWKGRMVCASGGRGRVRVRRKSPKGGGVTRDKGKRGSRGKIETAYPLVRGWNSGRRCRWSRCRRRRRRCSLHTHRRVPGNQFWRLNVGRRTLNFRGPVPLLSLTSIRVPVRSRVFVCVCV